MSITLAIIALGLLIVLHEGGHYLAAIWTGMRVERFSIGFGPTLLGWKRGETVFQIAPIPLGGFVQITGLNPNEEFDATDPRVYPNRPLWARLAVVLAGPAANYLTAFVVVLVLFLTVGMATRLKVDEAVAGKPAALAGFKAGDVILEANGRRVDFESPLTAVIADSEGKPVSIKVLREGREMTLVATPEKQPGGTYLIGVKLDAADMYEPVSVGRAVTEAARYPVILSGRILQGLYEIVARKRAAEVTGPVGIAKHMAKAADLGVVPFINVIAMLSVYLGLFNLLPLPALDGGRAIFLGVEAVTRRRVNARIETAVHTVGFVLLFGLLLLVTVKDIFG